MPASSVTRRPVTCFSTGLVAVLAGALTAGSVHAENTGEPPARYREQLAPWLTPIEQVLQRPAPPVAPNDSGCTLVNEHIISVDAQGRRLHARQVAYKTLTDAGVKSNSDEVVTFRKKEQKVYLVVGETIQPDGTRLPVKPDAVLLQSPQRQAEYSLYDDQEELKVIFPDVKAGSIIHLIVVIEDLVSRMPGEYSQSFAWGGTWATGLMRYRVELPAEMAARLKIESVGRGVPAARVETLADGRVAHTWVVEQLAGLRYEIDSEPAAQIGPAINLGTLHSWNEVGKWYRGLVDGRDQPDAKLAGLADGWTAKAKGRAELIALLHAKVADQVRYVGLEFGAADYQPHSCNEVWNNQYGDCKDKANLLVALLRHRGIKACLALVNTEHSGWVDRRVPNHQVFDHAIVAIPGPEAGYLFCDPTIGYSEPGTLGPGSSDRDVLVITDTGAEWVHTPPLGLCRMQYDFDLRLSAAGELAGWLTIKSTGYYAASERERFTQLDREDTRSEMSQIVRGFYQGAEVIDAAKDDSVSRSAFAVKAYFVVAGQPAADDGSRTLRFPRSGALFTNLGDTEQRSTNFFLYKDDIRLTAKIALPKGLRPTAMPAAFRFDSATGANRAGWKFESGACLADLDLEVRQAVLKPADFGGMYRSYQSLQTWLAQPLVLTRDKKAAEQQAAPVAELDLPMMATGDGQITLVDDRYPEKGSPAMRRLALERSIQYFPNDPVTVFRAGVRLAVLDWNADKNAEAHERISGLLRSHSGLVKPEIYSWGEYLDGMVLRDLHRPAEALAILQRVARDKGLSDGRRSDAAVAVADLLEPKSSAEALALLQEIAALPDGATPEVESRIAHLLLAAGRTDELRQNLAALIEAHPDACEEQIAGMLDAAAAWKSPAEGKLIQTFAGLAAALRPDAGEALQKAIRACRLEAANRAIRAELTPALVAAPLADWYKPVAKDQNTSLEDFQKQIDQASNNGTASECLRLTLRALGSHDANGEFPRRLWEAANMAEWAERKDGVDPKVCLALLDLCDQLPADEEYRFEGQLLRAGRLARIGDRAGEQALLRGMIATPGLPARFLAPACKRLGLNLELSGDTAGALVAYKPIEPIVKSYGGAADCLLHAVLINLHRGDDAEAIRLLHLLDGGSDELFKATDAGEQLRALVALAKTGRAADYWAASRKWWPDWLRLARAQNVNTDDRETVVPEIASLTELGSAMGTARRAADSRAYFAELARLVSAARWQPALAVEVASVGDGTMQVMTEGREDFRHLLIALLAQPQPPEIDGLRSRQIYLAANYFDGNQPAETLRVAAEFAAVKQPDDNVTRAMHRLRAMGALATGQELALSAAELEKDLSDPKAGPKRASTAGLLADLDTKLGHEPEAEAVLKRELANPVVTAETDGVTTLRNRYDKLTGGRNFVSVVEKWIGALGLPWYDYAEPRNLEDSRLQDLDEVLKYPQKYFQPVEQVKLRLLAAQDLRRPLEARRESLRAAALGLLQFSPDYTRFDAVASSVIENQGFDEETRLRVLWSTLVQLSNDGRTDDYQRWRKNALCLQFNTDYQARLAILDLQARTDRTSSNAILQLGETLTGREMNSVGLMVLNNAFQSLLRLGDDQAAEKLVAGGSTWKLAAEISAGAEAAQFEFARQIRLSKPDNAMHEALAGVARTRFPDPPAALPPEYRELRLQAELPVLGDDVTFAAARYLIHTRQFGRTDFKFWGTFLRALPAGADHDAVVKDLLQAALGAAGTDVSRAAIIELFTNNVDIDDPALRQIVENGTAPFRKADADPVCYAGIRYYETIRDFRLGRITAPETALADVNEPRAAFMRQYLTLRYRTQKGDRTVLKQTIDAIDASLLVNPGYISLSIPAFERLGMETELRLARGAARRNLDQAVAESWATRDPASLSRVLVLAPIVGDSAALPAGWVKDLSSGSGDPRTQHYVLLIKAWLDADWGKVESEAAGLVQQYPTYYSSYWYRGVAAQKLARKDEAVTALQVYVKYAKDEQEYPQAVEILKSLGHPVSESR